MKDIKVYTRTFCSYCDMTKNLLKSRKLDFEEIDLTHDMELREKLANPHKWRTLPMIFIGEEFIGGFRELAELDKQGQLTEKLSSN